jgi:phage repressor protein C with HTH and peptisase S24 domain
MKERIQDRLDERGISQGELARLVGVSQPTIWKLVSGNSQNSRFLHKVARELGTSVEYLTGESDDPGNFALPAPAPTNDNLVEIAEIDLAYGMGASFLDEDDGAVVANTMPFPREWLRNFTRSPADQLFFARGAGDSMMPTIHDSDIVLIDRSQATPKMADQIWAFAFGGVGMIKRLRPRPDGSVAILSDNTAVPADRAVDGELHIIGRVVAVQKKV